MTTEASSLSWSVFFCGTKQIANHVHEPNRTYDGELALILDWVFYHDAMYKFSVTHWVQRNWDQTALAKQTGIISKAVFSPLRQVVRPNKRATFFACAKANWPADTTVPRLLPRNARRSLSSHQRRLGPQHRPG